MISIMISTYYVPGIPPYQSFLKLVLSQSSATSINADFDKQSQHLTTFPYKKRLSKIDTLLLGHLSVLLIFLPMYSRGSIVSE